MRLLHTSDWHLGATESEHSLKLDQIFFIDEICKIIREENVDAVLIAGDVYDRSIANTEAINLYDLAMTKICKELGKPVLCIAGNHDGSSRLANCNELLKDVGLHLKGAITSEPTIVEFDDIDVYLMPWFTIEKVKSIFPEEADCIGSMTDAYRVVCNHYKETFKPNKKHIAVSHAFITNSETSTSDRAAEVGFATQVDANVFDGFDYVALGHIHRPQDVTDTIRYSGTPMIYSFGKEEKQEKSVTIIDTDTMEKTIVPLNLLHKWTTVEGTLEELKNPTISEEEIQGYIRLRITDTYLGIENTNLLKDIYPNALDICGKSFEAGDGITRLSMEEFRQLESDPVEIFKHFIEDVGSGDVSEHLIELFRETIEECNTNSEDNE